YPLDTPHPNATLIPYTTLFRSARHEGNAVTMADVYARMSGEPTLATVHSGPGLTNAATAIAEAAKSGTPILVLAGDVDPGSIHSDRKSTRLNSSHQIISYAVFC